MTSPIESLKQNPPTPLVLPAPLPPLPPEDPAPSAQPSAVDLVVPPPEPAVDPSLAPYDEGLPTPELPPPLPTAPTVPGGEEFTLPPLPTVNSPGGISSGYDPATTPTAARVDAIIAPDIQQAATSADASALMGGITPEESQDFPVLYRAPDFDQLAENFDLSSQQNIERMRVQAANDQMSATAVDFFDRMQARLAAPEGGPLAPALTWGQAITAAAGASADGPREYVAPWYVDPNTGEYKASPLGPIIYGYGIAQNSVMGLIQDAVNLSKRGGAAVADAYRAVTPPWLRNNNTTRFLREAVGEVINGDIIQSITSALPSAVDDGKSNFVEALKGAQYGLSSKRNMGGIADETGFRIPGTQVDVNPTLLTGLAMDVVMGNAVDDVLRGAVVAAQAGRKVPGTLIQSSAMPPPMGPDGVQLSIPGLFSPSAPSAPRSTPTSATSATSATGESAPRWGGSPSKGQLSIPGLSQELEAPGSYQRPRSGGDIQWALPGMGAPTKVPLQPPAPVLPTVSPRPPKGQRTIPGLNRELQAPGSYQRPTGRGDMQLSLPGMGAPTPATAPAPLDTPTPQALTTSRGQRTIPGLNQELQSPGSYQPPSAAGGDMQLSLPNMGGPTPLTPSSPLSPEVPGAPLGTSRGQRTIPGLDQELQAPGSYQPPSAGGDMQLSLPGMGAPTPLGTPQAIPTPLDTPTPLGTSKGQRTIPGLNRELEAPGSYQPPTSAGGDMQLRLPGMGAPTQALPTPLDTPIPQALTTSRGQLPIPGLNQELRSPGSYQSPSAVASDVQLSLPNMGGPTPLDTPTPELPPTYPTPKGQRTSVRQPVIPGLRRLLDNPTPITPRPPSVPTQLEIPLLRYRTYPLPPKAKTPSGGTNKAPSGGRQRTIPGLREAMSSSSSSPLSATRVEVPPPSLFEPLDLVSPGQIVDDVPTPTSAPPPLKVADPAYEATLPTPTPSTLSPGGTPTPGSTAGRTVGGPPKLSPDELMEDVLARRLSVEEITAAITQSGTYGPGWLGTGMKSFDQLAANYVVGGRLKQVVAASLSKLGKLADSLPDMGRSFVAQVRDNPARLAALDSQLDSIPPTPLPRATDVYPELYHGSSVDNLSLTSIDPIVGGSTSELGPALYLTPDPIVAAHAAKATPNVDLPTVGRTFSPDATTVYSVVDTESLNLIDATVPSPYITQLGDRLSQFLIQRPLSPGGTTGGTVAGVIDAFNESTPDPVLRRLFQQALVRRLVKDGYDGVSYESLVAVYNPSRLTLGPTQSIVPPENLLEALQARALVDDTHKGVSSTALNNAIDSTYRYTNQLDDALAIQMDVVGGDLSRAIDTELPQIKGVQDIIDSPDPRYLDEFDTRWETDIDLPPPPPSPCGW